MYIHGLKPGPMLMVESADVFWFIVGAVFVGNIFLLIFGFTGIKIFTKVVEVPKYILMPTIIILSVVGAYTINNSLMDIYWMMGFGVIGYLLKFYKIPVGPIILGVILSSLIEQNFRRGISMTGNSLAFFIKDLVKNPISLILLLAISFMIISQTKWFRELFKRHKDNE